MTATPKPRADAVDPDGVAAEARRQQLLLQALWRRGDDAVIAGWLREAPARRVRGLAAYRANGEAIARRALAAAYPTVAALVGEEAFAAIAAIHWLRHPPRRGDVALFGDALPDALAGNERLAGLPYLADVARLDWAIHRCESAADDDAPVEGLDLLGDADPAALRLALRPGMAVVQSPSPIVALWRAHHSAVGDGDPFAPARAALARGEAQSAVVWRSAWRAEVDVLAPADARFTAALLAPHTLATAWHAAGTTFEFEPWLLRALRQGWLRAVVATVDAPATVRGAA